MSISNQIRKIDASTKKATIHTATSNSKIDDLKAMIKISTLRWIRWNLSKISNWKPLNPRFQGHMGHNQDQQYQWSYRNRRKNYTQRRDEREVAFFGCGQVRHIEYTCSYRVRFDHKRDQYSQRPASRLEH